MKSKKKRQEALEWASLARACEKKYGDLVLALERRDAPYWVQQELIERCRIYNNGE